MSLAQTIFRKGGNTQFVRFVVVGSVNTAISYVVFVVLSALMPYTIAFTIDYVLVILISYMLNTHFVFRTKFRWRSLLAYPIVYVIQYALGMILLPFLIEILNLDRLFAASIVIVTTPPVTFIASRLILKDRPVQGATS